MSDRPTPPPPPRLVCRYPSVLAALACALGPLACSPGAGPAAPPAKVDAGAPTEPAPAPAPVDLPPTLSAVYAAAASAPAPPPAADGGAAASAPAVARVVPGPALGVDGAVPETAWTLPEVPQRWDVRVPNATAAEVRLEDAGRLPWAARVESAPGGDGGVRFTVTPLAPLATGATYFLVVERVRGEPPQKTSWAVPVSVESGATDPAPWTERPKPAARRGRRR